LIKSAGLENEALLVDIQEGIKQNAEMIKSNVAYLRGQGLNKERIEKANKLPLLMKAQSD